MGVNIYLRVKRLFAEWERMQMLNSNSKLITIESYGNPPEKYIITYHCKGLIWIEGNSGPSISHRHQIEMYLHKDFPRLPPQLKCLTNIFHPNILPSHKNGGVCIGNWSPAETLDQLCLRIGEMIQYRNYNINDALDIEAARWSAKHLNSFPLDNRDFLIRKGSEQDGILNI